MGRQNYYKIKKQTKRKKLKEKTETKFHSTFSSVNYGGANMQICGEML